jgi:GT2 family glycosyltransferase
MILPEDAGGVEQLPDVSIVLPAYNEGLRLRETLEALRDTISRPYEAVVVNDASSDGCCEFLCADTEAYGEVIFVDLPKRRGVAHCRNLGAERATGPIMVTMDAHCVPQAGWIEKLLAELEKPGVGIAATRIVSADNHDISTFGLTIHDREFGVQWLHRKGETPYEIPAAGCACLAMSREWFVGAGRFDELRGYGMEDVELCLRCWLLGYAVVMVPDAVVGHWFKRTPTSVGWHDFLYNRLRTAVLHFDGERLKRILDTLRAKPEFNEAVTSLLASDVWTRYSQLRERRVHDADWFCDKFGIKI